MFNLIQTQEALRGLPLPDVMKYANGSSPEVPAYLALTELNRRKQLEDTQNAFESTGIPTVKDQIQSSLTASPQGQVNPTAQASQIANPTNTPPQLAPSPAAPPQQIAMPTAPVAGVNPSAPPRMASGGLTSIALPHMFNQSSYQNGGIVYFGDSEKNPKEDQQVKTTSRFEQLIPDFLKPGNDRQKEYLARVQAYKDLIDINKRGPGFFGQANAEEIAKNDADLKAADARLRGNNQQSTIAPSTITPITSQAQMDVQDRENGRGAPIVKPTAVPANPNQQASATSSAQVKPPPFLPEQFKSTIPNAADVQSPEAIYAQQNKIKALAGVSDDPMKEMKERYQKLEDKRAEQEKGDQWNNLMARLSAFSQAAPEKGFGYQSAVASEAAGKMQKEQEALRDKQAVEMNALQMSVAKEDDARKRGNAKGVEDEIAVQKKLKLDILKLQNEEKMVESSYMNALTNRAELPFKATNAQANMIQAQRPHALNSIQSLEDLYQNNPELAKMYLGQAKVGVMTKEDAYKAVLLDPKSFALSETQKQEAADKLYNWANGKNNPPSAEKYPPTTVVNGKTLYLHPDNKYYSTRP